MRNKEKYQLKIKAIKRRYAEYSKKYKHWKNEYIVKKIAEEFFLSEITVYNILKKKENENN